jgi:hypothetical protein
MAATALRAWTLRTWRRRPWNPLTSPSAVISAAPEPPIGASQAGRFSWVGAGTEQADLRVSVRCGTDASGGSDGQMLVNAAGRRLVIALR